MPDDERIAAVPEERCAVELGLRHVLAGQVGRDRGVPKRIYLSHDLSEAPPAMPGSVHENESRHRGEYPNPEPRREAPSACRISRRAHILWISLTVSSRCERSVSARARAGDEFPRLDRSKKHTRKEEGFMR